MLRDKNREKADSVIDVFTCFLFLCKLVTESLLSVYHVLILLFLTLRICVFPLQKENDIMEETKGDKEKGGDYLKRQREQKRSAVD